MSVTNYFEFKINQNLSYHDKHLMYTKEHVLAHDKLCIHYSMAENKVREATVPTLTYFKRLKNQHREESHLSTKFLFI